jgi:hypothetical protein
MTATGATLHKQSVEAGVENICGTARRSCQARQKQQRRRASCIITGSILQFHCLFAFSLGKRVPGTAAKQQSMKARTATGDGEPRQRADEPRA